MDRILTILLLVIIGLPLAILIVIGIFIVWTKFSTWMYNHNRYYRGWINWIFN